MNPILFMAVPPPGAGLPYDDEPELRRQRRAVRAPILMDGLPIAAERPSPGLGQHTDDVLRDPAWGG